MRVGWGGEDTRMSKSVTQFNEAILSFKRNKRVICLQHASDKLPNIKLYFWVHSTNSTILMVLTLQFQIAMQHFIRLAT